MFFIDGFCLFDFGLLSFPSFCLSTSKQWAVVVRGKIVFEQAIRDAFLRTKEGQDGQILDFPRPSIHPNGCRLGFASPKSGL